MTTFSRNIIICPHCKFQMSVFQLMSYTVFENEVFTDGKNTSSPFVSNSERIKICYNCSKEFWQDDAEIIDPDNYDIVDELPGVLDIYDLPMTKTPDMDDNILRYYEKLLNNDFCNSDEKEIYLRILLWQKINDRYRYSRNFSRFLLSGKFRVVRNIIISKLADGKYKALFNKNLIMLIDIYKTTDDDSRLFVAEMYRELGKHRKCASLLNEVVDKNNYYNIIKRANLFRKKRVIKLS